MLKRNRVPIFRANKIFMKKENLKNKYIKILKGH